MNTPKQAPRHVSRQRKLLQALIAVLVLVFCCLPVGLRLWGDPSGRGVLYIVPNGYHGPVRMYEDPDADPVPIEEGRYVVRIPQSGRLVVRDLSFLTMWHSEDAQREDGTPLNTFLTQENGDEIGFMVVWGQVSSSEFDSFGYRMWTQAFVGSWNEVYLHGGGTAEPGAWKPPKKPKPEK